MTIEKNPEFAVHMLNELGKLNASVIQDAFDVLLNGLVLVCIEGRSLSLCKTKLEEACFYAKKAMAMNLTNQECGQDPGIGPKPLNKQEDDGN